MALVVMQERQVFSSLPVKNAEEGRRKEVLWSAVRDSDLALLSLTFQRIVSTPGGQVQSWNSPLPYHGLPPPTPSHIFFLCWKELDVRQISVPEY